MVSFYKMTARNPKVPKKISPSYLRNSGLYYLQRYVASSGQFRNAMKRKINRSCLAHPDQEREPCYLWLEEVISEFMTLGYLNDDAYLRGMLQSLRRGKGLSRRMIVIKLKEKGFSEEDILRGLQNLDEEAAAPEGHRTDDTELSAALRFAERKKLGPYHPSPPRKTPEQQLSSLARAGFSYDVCKKVLETEGKTY
ncbi:MAG: RecX family transcriptional regulator [Rhodospirillales bacterium]|nr:RecX family transcriptional regulator [Rhodospirillales bacterium]